MKHNLLKTTALSSVVVIVLILILNFMTGNPPEEVTKIKGDIHKINSIDPRDDSWEDLAFLAEELKNKRIVVMGESTHSDGSAFLAKTRLIKYLHEELGFDVIAFEAGRYDMWRLNSDSTLLPQTALYDFWSISDQTEPLWSFLKSNEMALAGFDIQPTGDLSETIRRDLLFDYLKKMEPNAVELWNHYYQNAVSFRQFLYRADSKVLFAELDSMVNLLKSKESSVENRVYISYLSGIKHWLDYSKKYQSGNPIRLAIRDSLMAENIISLAENEYQNRKIILWMSNLHAFKDNHQFFHTSFINTGERINKHFRDEIYTILFSSYCRSEDGQIHNFAGFNTMEYALHKKGDGDVLITNLSQDTLTSNVNQDISFRLSLKNMTDALFFIDTVQTISDQIYRKQNQKQ